MSADTARPNGAHLFWGVAGFLLGGAVVRSAFEDSKKSRAERDDPDGAEEVTGEIGPLLEAWEPSEDCETEDDYTQDLAGYLASRSEWEIEVYPDSPEGKPDILIGDLLAIELKIDPSKGERDRLIGQCAGYSRLWITWAVVVDASDSKIGRLVDLLEDRGLDQIAVWSF